MPAMTNAFQRDLFRPAPSLAIVENPTLKGYKFIDLFAGIGGIRTPFDELGAKCVFSSEWDKFSQITYEANYGDKPFGDITKISEVDIPRFDILLAGFPCQPFSNAGLKKGLDDTRGTLFFEICRIANHHRPSLMLLENVKGFKSHDKGRTFKIVCEKLNSMGYFVHTKVLNSKDFGVPQNRERIFILAFREDVDFHFPNPPNPHVEVGDILENDVAAKYTISDRMWDGHQKRKKAHGERGNGFGYCLFNHSSKYTSTISARYYKDGSEALVAQEGKNPRMLTPRETARLQGFSDEFKIPVSDNQAYRQFGNSVSVPVIRAIANQIAIALQGHKNEN